MKHLYLLLAILFLASCGTNEKIIFSSTRDGKSDIYMMDPDGGNLTKITDTGATEWAPTIKNKNEISFLREAGKITRNSIHLKTQRETEYPHPRPCRLRDKNMLYAPKGKACVFECEGQIYLTDLDGRQIVNLTSDLPGESYKACWFPNGKRIAFTYNFDKNPEIYAMNIDRSEVENISQSNGIDEGPDVSPDGKKILFSSGRDGKGNMEIYVMDLETREVRNITNTPDWELIGRWSSDSKRIYYGSNKDGNWELYSYTLATGATLRLTENEGFDGDPRVLK